MTTSMETKSEIARFLHSKEPCVLCVSGDWGVGKTFLWQTTLDELRSQCKLTLDRYSYVSLFGLGSLDDVKAAIFENMEWLDQEAIDYVGRGKAGLKKLLAHAKKLTDLAEAFPVIGQAVAKTRSLHFSIIRNQIVCIDDLERRSNNLDVKDVLGLVSFLREQRGCKIALLLNAERLGDRKDEFDYLLEKVIETKVVLAPTATESASIAISGRDDLSVSLRKHGDTLGIRNIRVIKQIERLVRRVDEVLEGFPPSIRHQATHSITLFGWSKYDRANAPKMDFLRSSTFERHLRHQSENTKATDEEEAWDTLLEKYKYTRTDDFDLALMNYVDSMILDVDSIQSEARNLQEQQRLSELHGTFEAAWRKFHDSFSDDEDKVVKEIVERTKKAAEVVSLPNLNEAMTILKELGRTDEASDLLEHFIRHRNIGFWTEKYPFARGPFLPEIDEKIKEMSKIPLQKFDVEEGLISAAENFDTATIAKLAAIPVQTYYDLIVSSRGDRLRKLVLSGLEFRRISNANDDMRKVVSLMEEALQMVAKTSQLNALRVERYGVSI